MTKLTTILKREDRYYCDHREMTKHGLDGSEYEMIPFKNLKEEILKSADGKMRKTGNIIFDSEGYMCPRCKRVITKGKDYEKIR